MGEVLKKSTCEGTRATENRRVGHLRGRWVGGEMAGGLYPNGSHLNTVNDHHLIERDRTNVVARRPRFQHNPS